MTFILAPAAAAVPVAALPAAALPAAALVLAVSGFAAAGTARAPMTCRSELNKLPSRFCVDPAGA